MRGVGVRKPKVCILCSATYSPSGGKQKACSTCAIPYWRMKHSEQARNRARKRKLEAIEYLGGKCSDCLKEHHPAVYEFHHLDPATKESDGAVFLQRTRETMFKELTKCVLLCANCHRLRHHTWNDNGV